MNHFINMNRIEKYELLDGSAIVDADFHVVTANEAMFQFMGISKRYDIVDVIHQVDLDDFINLANNLHINEQATIVVRMKRVDNSYRWMFVLMQKIEVMNKNNKSEDFLKLKINDVYALYKDRNTCIRQRNRLRFIASAQGEFIFDYDHITDCFVLYQYIDDDAVEFMKGTLNEIRTTFISHSNTPDVINEFFDKITDDSTLFKTTVESSLFSHEVSDTIELVATSSYKNGIKFHTVGSIRNLNQEASYSINTYKSEALRQLLSYDEVHEYAKVNIASQADTEVNLILFHLDNYDDLVARFGEDKVKEIYIEIFYSIQNEIGKRGVIGTYNKSTLFIAIKNLYNDTNLRAFIEAQRSMLTWKLGIANEASNITFSIGAARYPYNGRDYDIITQKLQKALEIAISKGRNRYIIYREHLHGEIE